MLQSLPPAHIDTICLWYVLQHSLSAFNKLTQYFTQPRDALSLSAIPIWQQLNIHHTHIARLQHLHSTQGQDDFAQCLNTLKNCCDTILFKEHADFPEALTFYPDCPPILFVQGNLAQLKQPQIAMVGSRKPSPNGAQIAFDFAHYFAEAGFTVTSGLALGIDAASHHGAIQKGHSIAVIGTGLDQCYPTAHRALVEQILQKDGTIISEFLPGTLPAKHHFPRRNRMISGLSLGTVVVEANLKSGSLITAKEAANQGKQVFAIPGHIYSEYHQGCHQLIREGATLIDHPQQVIDDLNMFGQLDNNQPQQQQPSPLANKETPHHKIVEIPIHLQPIYECLDWHIGASLDEIALKLQQNIAELNIALVQLELLGLCKQHAGRYIRC